ncbi:MAG: hydrogenase nickel incorporation protein HypB [Spirochaetota bacterium]|nr:hydrogenase nickel incorporation protein HypB [Spirochaetota bacterium]
MCDTCGCESGAGVTVELLDEKPGAETQNNVDKRVILVQEELLGKNDEMARVNRKFFESKGIKAYNLMSSPGSGKTSLLERTIADLKGDLSFYVIEGDQQTTNDARRIGALAVPVVQVNTGSGCHLDSQMIHRALHKLNPIENSVLMIENVGNLVCPAMFDLGEKQKVVVISVTEGEDKPVKYPHMFESADICIINKIDLLPYVDFNLSACKEYALKVNKNLTFFELSVRTGEGMSDWCDWLKEQN